MEKKIINSFKTESNNEEIIVNVIQSDKGIIVNITGNTMDVIVNDDLLYSKFDKEEYKYIPVNLRSFIADNLCSWGDGIIIKDDKIECILEFNCEEYYVEIPKNRAKNKTIYINNWLNSYKKIYEHGIEIPNGEENLEKLISQIKDKNCDFVYRWDCNEYDDTWGLKIDINKFDENKVIECITIWTEYNTNLEKYISMI